MNLSSRSTAIGAAALAGSFLLTASITGGSAAAAGDGSPYQRAGVDTHAKIRPLNQSGATGSSDVHVRHRRIAVEVDARGLAKKLPHAQHIHFGAQARHECPTLADDTNGDHRLTTLEGAPAYGPVRVSLTLRGDTSPDSVLAVDRYPTAPHGRVDYDRKTRTSKPVARAIRRGEAVVVIHGVDYNDNGVYDFKGAGKSDLNPKLPAEATDPAACGVLHRR